MFGLRIRHCLYLPIQTTKEEQVKFIRFSYVEINDPICRRALDPSTWGRPHFLHQSSFEYASQSALHCHWAKVFIKDQLDRGKTHPTAVRALAFKWQRIMFVCWRDRVPYDETTYLASLKRRGSHLTHKLDQELPKAA